MSLETRSNDETFVSRARAAYESAYAGQEFVPSRAEISAAMTPLVSALAAMPRAERESYVRATFDPRDNGCRLAAQMLREVLA